MQIASDCLGAGFHPLSHFASIHNCLPERNFIIKSIKYMRHVCHLGIHYGWWWVRRNGWDLCVRRIKFPFLSDGNPFVFFHHSNRLYHIIPSSSHSILHFHLVYVRTHPRRPPHFTFYHLFSSLHGPEEGSLFVHVLMLRINFFRAPWAEAKMVLGEIFFTYGKFVYFHFHLRPEFHHC